MKSRSGFISNSSTTAFVFLGFDCSERVKGLSEDDRDGLLERLEDDDVSYLSGERTSWGWSGDTPEGISLVIGEVLTTFSDAERSALMGLFGHLSGSALFFLLIPMAFGGVLFFSLFFRSRFIPRWLAAWGVMTYAIIGCVAATVLLFPD